MILKRKVISSPEELTGCSHRVASEYVFLPISNLTLLLSVSFRRSRSLLPGGEDSLGWDPPYR